MTQIAIVENVNRTSTDLMDNVSDAQYDAPVQPQEATNTSRRIRSLVTVSALIAMDRPDQLRSHLALARENEVTREEIIDAITHLACYAGWPNAMTAVTVAREVLAGSGR